MLHRLLFGARSLSKAMGRPATWRICAVPGRYTPPNPSALCRPVVIEMAVFTRVILALSLLLQSIPGLTTVNCASMAPRVSAAVISGEPMSDALCACCSGSADAECPAADNAMSCRCGVPQPEEPRSLPFDPKIEQSHQLVALLPVLIAVLPTEPIVLAERWAGFSGPPRQSASSFQSLLCVWVV